MTFNLLLQLDWLNYNHLYIFGTSLHQQEYKVLRKGLNAGLSKHQIFNWFSSQGVQQIYLLFLKDLVMYVMERYLLFLQPLKDLVVYVMERYLLFLQPLKDLVVYVMERYLLLEPLKDLSVYVTERYEQTFTMIARIFHIHQQWTPHKRICCCWMIAS